MLSAPAEDCGHRLIYNLSLTKYTRIELHIVQQMLCAFAFLTFSLVLAGLASFNGSGSTVAPETCCSIIFTCFAHATHGMQSPSVHVVASAAAAASVLRGRQKTLIVYKLR
jgi:hypothetical protein